MNPFPRYDFGRPNLTDLWVDPAGGNDANDGATRAQALRTVAAAWARVPADLEGAATGYRLMLAAGSYPGESTGRIELLNRRGSFACPILLVSADGPHRAQLPSIHLRDCRHVHLLGLHSSAGRSDVPASSRDNVIEATRCHHVLLRGIKSFGVGDLAGSAPRIVLKAAQCQHLYVEDCDFSHVRQSPLAYVAVQYGHIVNSRFSQAAAECLCVKGGSAHLVIAGNDCSHSANHGICAGQGTGFAYLVPPWLHYEAYDIKIVNNLVRDCGGGIAVGGGYNVLVAFNTCYRVGHNHNVFAFPLGGHHWIDLPQPSVCEEYHRAGGWCDPTGQSWAVIPNKNVYLFNNLVLNPPPYRSGIASFAIPGPIPAPANSNLPPVLCADDHLVIRGNIVFNGGPEMPLFDTNPPIWGLVALPTYDGQLILRDNVINRLMPQLIDPEAGDFRPRSGGNLPGVLAVAVPDFPGGDAPQTPPVPQGSLDNQLALDRSGHQRSAASPPGAYA